MKRTEFTYELPPEMIAQTPRERGRSRMLAVTPREGAPLLEHTSIASLPSELKAGDLLVLNDTRVIPARLFARPKEGMSRPIEIFLTRALECGGKATAFSDAPESGGSAAAVQIWEAWAKPAKRVKPGDVLTFSDVLSGVVLARNEATVTLRFEGDLEEIERIGVMPLPPYIARPEPREEDREAYQTVYAEEPGSIAAPTAGLHFSPELLDEIARLHVEIIRTTLHVGIGTFQPVKADDIAEHRMQTESYHLSELEAARLNGGIMEKRRFVAVGTTAVRLLESAIRAGNGRFQPGRAETNIFITPGFDFRIVDSLLTNFHLPESTLLMLVSAFAGMETVRAAYREAIRERYFFFSYGDCMFLRNRGRW